MTAIALHNLTLGYERHPAVHHLEGGFATGQVNAIVGPNGSGKSTLLKGIAGTLRPLAGRIARDGISPGQIAYLAQESGVVRDFPLTIEGLVTLGLWNQRGLFGRIGPQDRGRVAAALAAVGLTGLKQRGLDEVSGGQLQRALFARVLVQDARLVLLDEPFAALDARTAADLADVVRRWPSEGRTVILVSHDMDLVRALASHTLVLAREAVAWGPTAEALTDGTLAAARRLSEGWASDAGVCHVDDDYAAHDQHHRHEHAA